MDEDKEQAIRDGKAYSDINRACTRWLIARGLHLSNEDFEAQRRRTFAARRQQSQERKLDTFVEEMNNGDDST